MSCLSFLMDMHIHKGIYSVKIPYYRWLLYMIFSQKSNESHPHSRGITYPLKKGSCWAGFSACGGSLQRHLPFHRSAILPGRAFLCNRRFQRNFLLHKKILPVQSREACVFLLPINKIDHSTAAITSTSQRTFLGRVFTATQERAGLLTKYFA